MNPLDGIRSDISALRSDVREDVNGIHTKLDAFIACYSTHHTETRERLAALEAVSEPTPSSKSRVKKYAPHAGIFAVLLTAAVEAGPALVKAISTPDAQAQVNQGKKP